MNKQIIHYGTAIAGLLTAIAAAVLSATSTLPDGNYKQMGVLVAGVLGAAAVGVKAFDAAIAETHVQADADARASWQTQNVGLDTEYSDIPPKGTEA